MAETNAAANGHTSQVKIHLTSRDENIQLPQDTGAILVATGKCLLERIYNLYKMTEHMLLSACFSLIQIVCQHTNISLQSSSVTSSPHWSTAFWTPRSQSP
jgi:hypothetical protein